MFHVLSWIHNEKSPRPGLRQGGVSTTKSGQSNFSIKDSIHTLAEFINENQPGIRNILCKAELNSQWKPPGLRPNGVSTTAVMVNLPYKVL